MKKFKVELSLKEMNILKNSLQRIIEEESEVIGALKKLKLEQLTDKGKKNIEEHENNIKCLDNLIKQMEHIKKNRN